MNPDTYSAEPTVCREERETSVADSTTKGSPESEATEGSSTSDKEDQETKQCNDTLDTSAEETDQQNCGDNPNNSTSPDEQLDDGDFDMPMISKPAQTTRHRSRITYGRKKELCLYKMEHPKASLNHLTKYFSRKWSTHVGRTTVCDILLHSQKWLSMPPDCHDMLRNTPPKYIKLDNALYSWYIEAQKKYGSSLTNDILIAKAKELGKKMNITDLSYSSGWLYSFKRRHKLLNPPTSSASRDSQSFGSITGQRSLYNLMSRAVAGDNMAHRAGLANRLNSGQQSDVMYPSDDNMGMPGMPQNVSFVEACQGLLTVISYLGSHREFGDDYLPFLWQIFQHICNQTQNDLMRAKQEQHLASENGFQMSMSSEREAADDLGTSEEQSNEVHSEDSMPKIKTEHLDPHYDQAMSGSQGDVGTAERSHPCSRCGQRFVVLTQLLDHMTNHVLADAQAHDMASDYSTNSKNDTRQEFISDNLDKSDLEGHSSRTEQMRAPRESLSGDGQQVNTKDHMSTTESSSMPLTMPGASSTGADCNGITSTATQGEMDELEMLKAAYRKSYKCEICGREFGNYSNFRRHVRLHSGRKPHKCTVCGKAFADPGSLQKHGTVHTGEKPYLCTVCGKRLTQATGLALHMRRHTGERPYECTVCGRRFAQSSSLREHSRVHTGEKPYHCSICDKRFPRSSDLVAHKRVHTGERPYQCTVCGKCFTQRGNLSKHGRAHTGEKPHKCSTCGKSFAEKCLLTAHVRVHTGERPFCCTLCGKTFSQSGSLFHHMKMHK